MAEDPALFFPDKGRVTRRAKQVCTGSGVAPAIVAVVPASTVTARINKERGENERMNTISDKDWTELRERARQANPQWDSLTDQAAIEHRNAAGSSTRTGI